MVNPANQTILNEIAEAERHIAKAEQSLHETMMTSHKVLIESRELIALIERQLRRGMSVFVSGSVNV